MTEHNSSPSVMRSKLGQARGLGAAGSGFHHWWGQRVTAMALLPLTIWFVWACVHMIGMTRADVAHFMANPLVTGLMIAMILMTFHHQQLGFDVIVDDYVRGDTKVVTRLILKGINWLLALVAIIAVLKIAFSG